MMYSAYQDGSFVHTNKGLVQLQIINDRYSVLVNEEHDALLQTHEEIEAALKNGTYIVDIPDVPTLILTDYQINDRDTRLMYVKTLEKIVKEHNVRPTTLKAYELMIEQVERDYPVTLTLNKHPAKSSVCRYWKKWVEGNFFDDALVSSRRNAPTRIHPASEAVLNDYIAKVWGSSRSKLRSAHYKAYRSIVERESMKNPNVLAVSQRTYIRRLNGINCIEEEINNPHTSEARRNQLRLTMQKKIKTHFALQRVEMDRVDVNLNLIDDHTHEVTGKASVYFAIDCFTRAIVGVVVDTGLAENKESVVNLIQQVFMKDDNLPFQGKPHTIVMDNGPGFNNATIQQLCQKLNIDAVYTPSNQPSKKPFVESFNNVFRTQFCSGFVINMKDKLQVGIPGYLGVRSKKGDDKTTTNLQQAAELYVSDFLNLLNIFLCEYSYKKHSYTKKSPFEAWRQSVETTIRSHYDYESVVDKFHVLQYTVNQKLYHNGTVHVSGNKFFSKELKALYVKTKSLNAETEVVVTLNPFDARYVTVSYFDTRTQNQYQIFATNINIDDIPGPVSFKALKGEAENSMGIHQITKHTVTGKYEATIEKLHVQTRRSKKRGKYTTSFEENNKAQISAKERVAQSNLDDSKLNVNLQANMRYTNSESFVDEIVIEDNVKVETKGKKPLW
jgi:putative transposase